ncbi:MAG: WcbI family polysaccharide biosynthesis putative acetyltransferase [Cyanobacteria bacterium P01_F01_bin.143]
MKTKIVTFGNCQLGHLKKILVSLLPSSEFDISYLSNNTRTGKMKSNQDIISEIRECDILFYQPLSNSHGDLSANNIKASVKKNCTLISIPYIFNSGAYSLCHAPFGKKHSYGFIFGQEFIIDILKSGKDLESIIDDYREGKIDFNLESRFNECLAEMKRRESNLSITIKVSEFIEQNYQNQKLFVTHSHPSNIVFRDMISQIVSITPLPIDENKLVSLDFPDLITTNCPVTPHDIKIHGYKFNADTDWFVKGKSLIELIASNVNS